MKDRTFDKEFYERVKKNSSQDHAILKMKKQILDLQAKKRILKGIVAFQAMVMLSLGGYSMYETAKVQELRAIEQERTQSQTEAKQYYDRIVFSMLNTTRSYPGEDQARHELVDYNYQKLAQQLIERIEKNQFDDSDVLISNIAKATNAELGVGHDVVEKMLPYMGYQNMSMDDYVKLKGYMNEEQFHEAMNAKEEWAYQMIMEQNKEKGLGL